MNKDIVSIEEIKQGYNGRKKYKVTTINKTYFIKVHHYKLNQKEIMQEKILYETYKKLDIPIVPLLDLIEYKNETIFVYPYFEGITLKDAVLTLEEYYKYGVKIAQEIMKLQKVSMDSKVFSKVKLDKYFKGDKKRIINLWKNEEYKEKIYNVFSKEELQELTIFYKSLLDFIQTIDPNRKIVKQLQYFLIANMINESEKLLTKYFDEIQENKEYMKKMLFNKEKFLEKIIYEGQRR